MPDVVIYKICDRSLWQAACAEGSFAGAPVDLADGFIHFSTAAQVRETAARHFHQGDDLVLVGIVAERLGPALRHEPSRGGALFPHLYGVLDVRHAVSVDKLPRGADGFLIFPDSIP